MVNVKDILFEKHKSKEDALTSEEVEAFISQAGDKREQFIALTLIFTGLRVGELTHLNRDWVDWQKDQIEIPLKQDCDCYDCKIKRDGLWSPKTKKGRRNIPILEERTKTIMKHYLTLHYNLGLTRQGVWAIVKKMARKANLTHKVYPHALRATAAMIFAHKNRMSAPTLAYVMGWKSIMMAEEYIRSEEARAMEEVEEIKKNERFFYKA